MCFQETPSMLKNYSYPRISPSFRSSWMSVEEVRELPFVVVDVCAFHTVCVAYGVRTMCEL